MEEKNENPVVEEVKATEEVKTDVKAEAKDEVLKEGGDMKVKPKKPKQLGKQESKIAKIDLSKVNETTEEVKEDNVAKVDLSKEEEPKKEEVVEEVKEEVTEEKQEEETPVIEEVTEEEVEQKVEETKEEVVEAIEEAKETGEPLPENIQKVVDFMNDTGGSLEDYVRLNQDYSSYDENQLLREYYKQTKPHLTDDEISFMMEDRFSVDEEVDEERDIKRKKLALKEQVANAKSHLDGLKSKYYEEIKAGSKLSPEQKKAVDFFNRYNKESKEKEQVAEQQKSVFNKKTEQVFNNEFKGFEYKVGDKRYRFNVKDANKVKESQKSLDNFISKFLNDKNQIEDAKGYHKALFTANNPDAIANHFYQQGKADAIKESMAKAKNVDMSPRQTHSGETQVGGMKVRAISGDDSSKLRVKLRK
jgi:hypothetical protein